MPIPWATRVRESGQLTLHFGESVTGEWLTLLDQAMTGFNDLFRSKGIGVRLAEASNPPARSGTDGADVAVAVADGQASASYAGETRSASFSGTRMHGLTLLFAIDGAIEKAFVFLPSRPMINTPNGQRPVGANIRKIIAIHEWVHACGLTNAEHSTDDLFQASPQVDPGDTPAGDRMRIQSGSGMSWMPPLVLSASTMGHLRRLW